ncbi:hypothetical protein RND71_024571 [Anisodus tanguticus]|uniref:Uncharacterized protein n=1 Tax=Anisodus tanguticus TaxID=243964 RepID=A0AAE1VCP4_9SOLA|nr:hypothetical protein RND71_024571 [Anisodus tanguticus]
MSKFRRTADAAKESIREYLGGWRGQKSVVNEDHLMTLKWMCVLFKCCRDLKDSLGAYLVYVLLVKGSYLSLCCLSKWDGISYIFHA